MPALIGARRVILASPRPAVAAAVVPSNAYNNVYSDNSNVTPGLSYTLPISGLAADHAKRLIVVGVHQTSNLAPSAVTILGVSATKVNGNNSSTIWYAAVPTGSSGNVVVTIDGAATTPARCAIAVSCIYPLSATPIDSAVDVQTSSTTAVCADVEIVAGGWLIWFVSAITNADNFTVTWSGTDAVVDDSGDVPIESASTIDAGHIVCTESNTTRDLSAAVSLAVAKALVAVSWGAQ